MRNFLLAFLLLLPVAGVLPAAGAEVREIRVEPSAFVLSGAGATQTLVVTAVDRYGTARDVTAEAKFASSDPMVITTADRVVKSVGSSGSGKVLVTALGLSVSASAEVKEAPPARDFSFEGDIAPIFSQNGCNNSSCHGSLKGQSGFHLSPFGYDPAADYKAVVKESDGRRVDLKDPEKSLILLKPTFQVKHGGGVRFTKTSAEYKALLSWLQNGAPVGGTAPKLLSLHVYPEQEIFLTSPEQKQQLVVVGRFSDGVEKDLSHEVNYKSNDDDVAAVDASGAISLKKNGSTAVMVRLLGVANAVRVAVSVRPALSIYGADYKRPKSFNYIDDYILDRTERLHIRPSELTSDAEYIRRISLDLTGTLPTPERVRRFLADRAPDKRSRLVDELFKDPGYGDFWAMKWGDEMGNTPNFLANGTGYYQWWLRQSIVENKPYDQFARELLTGLGNRYSVNPSSFFGYLTKTEERGTFVAQTFMGLSLECARCHDHPREKWKRDDYLGLAAFFSQMANKTGPRINENYNYLVLDQQFYHPDHPGKVVPARFPGADHDVTFEPGEDRRERLANWLTARDNPYFSPTIVNRIWKQFMGRGIVDPDDFRVTNPPSHPELLARLSKDFVDHGYDLRYLMKLIATSRTYQLSAEVNETNRDDKDAFSHHYSREMIPEQMLDAIVQVTGVSERFAAFPEGKKAIQLPDDQVPNYFLETFNRPSRVARTCIRDNEPTVTQALHLVSGDTINKKVHSDQGRLNQMLAQGKSDKDIAEYFTLAALSRPATATEVQLVQESARTAPNRRAGLEDYLWALMNSKEFLYNH